MRGCFRDGIYTFEYTCFWVGISGPTTSAKSHALLLLANRERKSYINSRRRPKNWLDYIVTRNHSPSARATHKIEPENHPQPPTCPPLGRKRHPFWTGESENRRQEDNNKQPIKRHTRAQGIHLALFVMLKGLQTIR